MLRCDALLPPTPTQHDALSERPTWQAARTANDLTATFTQGAGMPPRPHQVGCVHSVCSALQGDCERQSPSNYLCQHATGAGKTLTIAALAHALTSLIDARGNHFSLVIVITDRKVLDEQCGGVVSAYFEALGAGDLLERATSCDNLRELLTTRDHGARTRVVITTFQKASQRSVTASAAAAGEDAIDADAADLAACDEVGLESVSAGAMTTCSEPRIAILADEAHRAHGHGTTQQLHRMLCGDAAQPRNISYISFSATPSEVALRLFGVENHEAGRREPFHVYSLRSALADRVCVDVLGEYTTAKPAVSVVDCRGRQQTIEALLQEPGGRHAGSVRALHRAATAQGALLEAKARGALEFVLSALDHAARSGFEDPKAMLVVRSRQECASYRRVLLDCMEGRRCAHDAAATADSTTGTEALPPPPLRILVAFSGSLVVDADDTFDCEEGEQGVDGEASDGGEGAAGGRLGAVVTEARLNGVSDPVEAFRRPGPALLIVCAKLETGFDEPRVVCMVIDRPLRGAHAVQVLGRANRAAPRKPVVRVLDFVNSAIEIGAAFRDFVSATSRPLSAAEWRAQLGREMAYISSQLLEMIGDGTIGTVAARALATDANETLACDLEQYMRGCERLGVEAADLPYGFAHRLLSELRTSHGGERGGERGLKAPLASEGRGGARGGGESDLGDGFKLRVGGLSTTFSGAIGLDAAPPPSHRTRPLTSAAEMKLVGSAGVAQTLSSSVKAAEAASEAAVRKLTAEAAGTGHGLVSRALSEADVAALHPKLHALVAGELAIPAGEALLTDLLARQPPSVSVLRKTTVGKTARRLRVHPHSTISALASSLLDKWRHAADAEERRAKRTEALGSGNAGGARSADGASGEAGAEDATRQTAKLLLAEALRAGERALTQQGPVDATSESAASDSKTQPSVLELAAQVERAVFAHAAERTGKPYKVKLRSLAGALRTPRAGELRKRLRDGSLSAGELCSMEGDRLSTELMSDEQKQAKASKLAREQRAIDMLRPEAQGEQSDEYRCTSCKGRRCIIFHTNSMGAVHLTAVPDIIVQCTDCGHRFTI